MAVLFLNETEQTVGILSWKFGYFSQVFRLSYVVKLINLVLTPVAFGSWNMAFQEHDGLNISLSCCVHLSSIYSFDTLGWHSYVWKSSSDKIEFFNCYFANI